MSKFVKLGDIADLTVGFVGTMAQHYTVKGIPFLRSLNIKPFEIYGGDMKYISSDFNSKIAKSILRKNDVVIVRTGAPGTCCVVPDEYDGCNCSDVVIVRPNQEFANPHYLAAYINFWGQKQISNNKVGAVQKHFNVRSAEQMLIFLPERDEQERIAQVIQSLNGKIQTNNRINDNLQQQLKLLYDYWFTQFDFPDERGKPYRSSGGQMIWNDRLKRDIPAGWQVLPLSQIMKKNVLPFDYSSKQPAIDLSVMPSDTIALSEINTSDNFTTNLFEMKKGDILFGSIRPYLHKAGFAHCDGVVTGTVHSYRAIDKQDSNFALLTIACDTFFDYAVNVSSGTKMPVVSSDSILAYNVPYNSEVVKRFGEISIVETIANNIQENQRLIALRDWLLPMLMNGQATISD